MSAFADVCRAVERVTRIRKRSDFKIVADCPICGRRRRLEIFRPPSGKVLMTCHAGCDTELVRERLGLDWPAFFEDVSYEAPARYTAKQIVLKAISADRWTLTTHAFAATPETAIAVECLERLLPACRKVRHLLRRRAGLRIDWRLFPLSVSFVQELAKQCGYTVGEHRAARMIKTLIASRLIERIDTLSIVREDGLTVYAIYRLADPATRSRLDLGTGREPPTTKLSAASRTGPATAAAMSDTLSARDGLSTGDGAILRVEAGALDALWRIGRGPPAGVADP